MRFGVVLRRAPQSSDGMSPRTGSRRLQSHSRASTEIRSDTDRRWCQLEVGPLIDVVGSAVRVDDIQFFAGKERSQEELFHTFNALLESQQQIVLTCDRYPKEVTGIEERLKSRFGWGLTVAIEPPELETRVAILLTKAQNSPINLPHEVAFFIGKRFRSNIRELEGALHRVVANAHFTGSPITSSLMKIFSPESHSII